MNKSDAAQVTVPQTRMRERERDQNWKTYCTADLAKIDYELSQMLKASCICSQLLSVGGGSGGGKRGRTTKTIFSHLSSYRKDLHEVLKAHRLYSINQVVFIKTYSFLVRLMFSVTTAVEHNNTNGKKYVIPC